MEHPMPQTAPTRADVYTRITAEIVAAIEAGVGDWRMPWHHDGAVAARPINVSSNKPYRGINILALWTASSAAQYSTGLWGTFRQWRALGAQVRKGERATTVVLWKPIDARGDQEDGESETRGRAMFARAFSVFNLAQVDGYTPAPVQTLPESERIAAAEAFIANLKIKTEFGGDRAYYRPSDDIIRMPSFAAFDDAVAFYGVWLHENGHASGAKHRLDRDLSGGYGAGAYAFEEIIVEQLSGMILADLGLAHHPRPDHAPYISSWLKALEDPRAIFRAASKAQQAADWMHAQQPSAAAIAA
jgi:antirestriction protein ArdC